METTTTTSYTRHTGRMAAIQGLAVVGFITLIVLGILLAIYSARFVPAAVSRVGSAAVELSQVFVPAHKSDLTVVPQIPFDTNGVVSTSTTTTTATTTVVTSPLLANNPPVANTAGPKTTTVVNGGVSTAPLYGQPDLAVTITDVGYLTSDNTDTFISSATVPSGYNAAVKFTVRNAGTNVSGNWVFNANLPTNSSYTYNSNSQQSLRPGERIDFTLGFDRAQNGVRTITVTVDPNNQISESSEGNNSAAHVISVN
jgi:hypothetical protein